MDVLVERCAGLDVHRDSVVATVRVPSIRRGQRHQETRTFGTTIRQLETLADWLSTFGVTLVGMEATGVYWKPVFAMLEQRFGCWLLNAQHLHNVPGRKTDLLRTRPGSASCWSTAWCGPASCHRSRCATCGT